MNAAQGWKTYLAAAVLVIGGIKLIAVDNHYQEGFQMLVAGLALVGIRGALAKVIEK